MGKDIREGPQKETEGPVNRFVDLARGVEKRLLEANRLELKESVVDSLWTGSDQSLKERLSREKSLPRGGVYSFKKDDGQLEQIFYIAPELRNLLGAADDQSRLSAGTEEFEAYMTLIEEISHAVYMSFYFETYGESPHGSMAEMVATLDQFNVLQSEYVEKYNILAPLDVQKACFRDNTGAYPDMFGITPGDYIIGHRMGLDLLGHLNQLHDKGGDAGSEYAHFYRTNNADQMKVLIEQVGLKMRTYSPYEREEVGRVIKELGFEVKMINGDQDSEIKLIRPLPRENRRPEVAGRGPRERPMPKSAG